MSVISNEIVVGTATSPVVKSQQPIEPLLEEDQNRFVLFPIKYAAIWNMYKKQVDCFWRAEEVDLTKDVAHWNSLQND